MTIEYSLSVVVVVILWGLFAGVGKPTPNIDRSADPDTHRALDEHRRARTNKQTNGQTDKRANGQTDATNSIISLLRGASRSIMICYILSLFGSCNL